MLIENAPAKVLLYRGHSQASADLLFKGGELAEADYTYHKNCATEIFESMTPEEQEICRVLPPVRGNFFVKRSVD